MKTQRTIPTMIVAAALSLPLGALLSLTAGHAATTSISPAPKTVAAYQANARIQQALRQELQARLQARNVTIAQIHHEFALKDAEIRKMRKVLARKDAVIHHLRAELGQPVNGG